MAGGTDMRHSAEAVSPAARGFQGGSSLAVDRAFVVHFGTDGGPGRRRFHGRVEHLSSGRAVRFSSLKTLLGFVAVILDGSQQAAVQSPIDRTRTTKKPAGARTRVGPTAVVGRPR
jgi:hypothetical protein